MRLIYWPTWTRLDGRLAGVGVRASAVFFHDQVAGFWPTVLAFPLLEVSMALMVMAGSDSRSLIGRRALPGAGPLTTGAHSLYLSHKAVFAAIANVQPHALERVRSAGLGVAVLAALVVGAALYRLVERPFLRLRDRLEGPSRSSLAVAAPTSVVVR